ncbi:MAG: hypothetical protein QM572_08860 [Nocardioides sp.]|uniref:hypothetical protein n=1 Tax=Nocardioides sp. TaxID=35761 RepID=UPI0039E66E1A
MRDDALVWGQAGLIADSFWVSSDHAGTIDPDRPNSVSAQRILPREIREPAPLALSLAELGSLDEIRVAWIRPPEPELTESMKSLEHLLREMLPPDVTRWLDIVVPSARTDATVAPLPGQWLQLRIVAEDRSAPDVTDAGWDLDLDVPLHSALIAVGILAGTFERLPWGAESAAEHYEFRTFSRLVLGALEASVEADRFITQTIPQSSAGSFYPTRFLELESEAAHRLLAEALTYILEADSATLSYNDPEPSRFQPPPSLTRFQHLLAFFRFLGFGLLLLLGLKAEPEAVVHSKYDFDDLGYNVDKPTPAIDWGVKIPDFDALDAEAAEEARKDLTALDRQLRRDPPMPPSRVWRSLVRLVTSINDGGAEPDGWDPPEHQDRKPVLAAAMVQPSAASLVTSDTPELAEARNAGIANAAIDEARRRRNIPLVALDDATGVVVTAQRLASEGNERDSIRLDEQLSTLSAPQGAGARSLLDQIGSRVIGAAIRARLDTERWTEWATGPSERDPLDWSQAERKFRKRTLIGIAVCAVIALIWAAVAYFARNVLPAWLTAPVGFIAVGALAVVFLLWSLYAFFRAYSAFLERGRRRLEVRRRWLERAQVAMREHARLRIARVMTTKWLDILAAIYPPSETTVRSVDRTMPATAPKGMAAALPIYSEREITKWLINEAAEVGWRMRALERVASNAMEASAADAVKKLVEDDGLRGGPLADLWERRVDLWTAHAGELRVEVSGDVARRFLEAEDKLVRILTPTSRAASPVTFGEFGAEPWPEANPDDLASWDERRDFTLRDGLARGGSGSARIGDDVCAVAFRMQLRRSTAVTRSAPVPVPVTETDGDDDGIF